MLRDGSYCTYEVGTYEVGDEYERGSYEKPEKLGDSYEDRTLVQLLLEVIDVG